MIGDVTTRPLPVVATHPMPEPANPSGRAIWASHITQCRGVRHEQLEQGDRVRTTPFTSRPCPIPSSRSPGDQPQQSPPADQPDFADRSRSTPPQYSRGSIRQRGFKPSFQKARIDTVQQAVKLRGNQARCPSAPMFPGRAPHGRRSSAMPGIDRVHPFTPCSLVYASVLKPCFAGRSQARVRAPRDDQRAWRDMRPVVHHRLQDRESPCHRDEPIRAPSA